MNTKTPELLQSSRSPGISSTVTRLPTMMIFDNNVRFAVAGLQNKMYAWSRKHNITFVEDNTADGIKILFGRAEDLTVFLLTWPYDQCRPRVIP